MDKTALPNEIDPADFRGFGSKILALYASSFKTVLMLDADNLPLIDPTRLLDHSSLASHGNLFWPDFFQREGLGIVSPEAYSVFQLSPPWSTDPDYHHTESGQFVVDRSVKCDSVHQRLPGPAGMHRCCPSEVHHP